MGGAGTEPRGAPLADSDLDDIWYYVASRSGSMEIADRLIGSITDRFFPLASHPHLGLARDGDLRPGLPPILTTIVRFLDSQHVRNLLRLI